MSAPRHSRRHQLTEIAHHLGVTDGELYHVHQPAPPRERYGPGWYLRRNGSPAIYLGYGLPSAVIGLQQIAAKRNRIGA